MIDLGDAATLGIIVYGGTETMALGPKIAAIPFPAFFGRE
jgi:hypothetical protein